MDESNLSLSKSITESIGYLGGKRSSVFCRGSAGAPDATGKGADESRTLPPLVLVAAGGRPKKLDAKKMN
jgi:hypothetical protein